MHAQIFGRADAKRRKRFILHVFLPPKEKVWCILPTRRAQILGPNETLFRHFGSEVGTLAHVLASKGAVWFVLPTKRDL